MCFFRKSTSADAITIISIKEHEELMELPQPEQPDAFSVTEEAAVSAGFTVASFACSVGFEELSAVPEGLFAVFSGASDEFSAVGFEVGLSEFVELAAPGLFAAGAVAAVFCADVGFAVGADVGFVVGADVGFAVGADVALPLSVKNW